MRIPTSELKPGDIVSGGTIVRVESRDDLGLWVYFIDRYGELCSSGWWLAEVEWDVE
jgi:hypothetical protein